MARMQDLIEPSVQALGLQLWGIEQAGQGKHVVLRIFIDSEAGVTIDDCEQVSRQLSAVLDVEQPIASGYTLEVSSPGLARPLFTPDQFARYTGEKVSVRMRGPVGGRRNFQGLVTGVTENRICLRVDSGEEIVALPFGEIEKANVVY